MVNQKAFLDVMTPNGPKSIRVTLVDTDATAATWTDYGAATQVPTDSDWTIAGIRPQGATAPTTATAFQLRVNGIDKPGFINGSAVYDAKASMSDRLGTLLGATVAQGSTLAIIGRA